VRVLLDSHFDDPGRENSNRAAVRYLVERARDEALDLDARVANPTGGGLHNKMVLVRHTVAPDGHEAPLDEGCDEPRDAAASRSGTRYWSHVGSLNGSEVASKVNREVAIQVESPTIYAHLARVFQFDWSTTHVVWFPAAGCPAE
jgi:phosphatidylserine/phosphatidylglycerophosphate/cardiolipin synthase-like enzyme